MTRPLRLGVCLLAGALALGGCTRPASPAPTPSSSSAAASSVTPSAGPTTAAPTVTPRQQVTSPQATAFPRGAKSELLQANPEDPDAIAKAFLTISHSWDCRTDEGPNAAGRRAIPLADSVFRRALEDARSDHGPDAAWREMCEHDGYTTVQIGPGGLGAGPSDSEFVAKRAFTVTITYRNDDGSWTKTVSQGPRIVSLSRQPGRWAVNYVQGA